MVETLTRKLGDIPISTVKTMNVPHTSTILEVRITEKEEELVSS